MQLYLYRAMLTMLVMKRTVNQSVIFHGTLVIANAKKSNPLHIIAAFMVNATNQFCLRERETV